MNENNETYDSNKNLSDSASLFDQLEITNQFHSEFIRNIEHDIRTPLCGIKSISTYLLSIETDKKKKEFLNDIDMVSNELLSYLDNIIEYSQLNSYTTPLLSNPFNLHQLIQSIVNLEVVALKSKHLDLNISYPKDIPEVYISDQFKIHRLLLSLVSNAIKFTNEGYVNITVKAIEQKPDNEMLVEIAVADSGIGISEKHQKMVFDKFFRCDLSNRGIYKGAGLGLWIVRQFIEELKGKLKLKSTVGKGSTFTCTIPMKYFSGETNP